MNPSDIFESLRRPSRATRVRGKSASGTPRFRISFADDTAPVEAITEKGKPWTAGYGTQNGAVRDALRALEGIHRSQQGLLSWSGETHEIALAEHDHLLPLLARTGRLVDDSLKPLQMANIPGQIRVLIDADDKRVVSRVVLLADQQSIESFSLLSEAYALAPDRTIVPVAPLGEQFRNLPLFNTHFQPDELERFLTLLYSTLDNAEAHYNGYKRVEGGERKVEPCVVFEEADEEGHLKLRIGLSMAGFPPEFVEGYEISRVATVNDLERSIAVSDVVYQSVDACEKHVLAGLKKAAAGNSSSYFQDDGFFLIDGTIVEAFLAKALPTLLANYTCLGAESLSRYRIRTGRPHVSVSATASGIDFLDTEITLAFDDQTISLADALTHFRKQGYIPLNDGSRALVNGSYIDKLRRIFKKRSDGEFRVSYFDIAELEELIDERERERIAGMESIARIRTALTSKKKAPVPRVNATLRPYQKSGYQWLHRLHAARLGGCLADDMGLGKTLQALTILRRTIRSDTPPSLIVMPRSLLFNWQAEIARFIPGLTCCVHHGTGRDLDAALKHDLLLTTYGTLRSDIEQVQKHRFHYVVLDESQNIKNPSSQAARAALLVNADHRLALSSTPVENNLTELFSLFRFLNPAMFESLAAFNRDYANPIARDGDRNAMRQLQRKIAPFILRRTKQQVLSELPPKVEQVLYVDMSDEQAALYETRRRFYRDLISGQIEAEGLANSQFAILQAFTELRQLASTPESKTDGAIASSKREVVIGELTEAVANGHKCLLFANFLGAVESLSDELNAAGIDHLVMTGATRDRERLVRRFQTDDSVRVFLMTLKTGGVGLNLTSADYVFIYDPWWNRAAETQAIDRTHRIGQHNTVFTYKLVARNTIEEKILKLQEMKGQLFDDLIGADTATLKSFSESDIEFALGVDT